MENKTIEQMMHEWSSDDPIYWHEDDVKGMLQAYAKHCEGVAVEKALTEFEDGVLTIIEKEDLHRATIIAGNIIALKNQIIQQLDKR